MAKLAAWSSDAQNGESDAQPRRLGLSQIGLERHLEDWIVKDLTLIGEGYALVGRQVSIDDGRLDLLAIDSQDRDRDKAREARFRHAKLGALLCRVACPTRRG